MTKSRILTTVLVMVVMLALWTAAYAKTFAFSQFEMVLSHAGLISAEWSGLAAASVLVAEYLLPVFILLPMTRGIGLLGAALLFTGFTGFTTYRILAKIGVPCSCFAGIFTLPPVGMLFLDITLLTIIVGLLWYELRQGASLLPAWFAAARLSRVPSPRSVAGRVYVRSMVTLSLALLLLTAGKLMVLVGNAASASQPKPDAEKPEPIHTVSAKEIIGTSRFLLGKKDAPFVLVEFGDYHCPPCRRSVPALEQLVKKYPGLIRIAFRHWPLVGLHPEAFQAAIAAEIADQRGKFPPFHRLLMTGPPNARTWQTAADTLGLRQLLTEANREDAARAQIRQDQRLAERLHLSGTPGFVLCRPDGTATRLPDLRFAEAELERAAKDPSTPRIRFGSGPTRWADYSQTE